MQKTSSRRQFLKKTASGVIGVAGLPLILPPDILGTNGRIPPSDKINLGLIGVGEMGTGHLKSFIEYDDIHIAAICDVNSDHRFQAKKIVDTRYGNEDCDTYNDFRELLSRKDIDAVVIATPDHWHALIGIEAARQGKHMYYEKPLSLFFNECQAMRQAINRYNVVFQLGTQQRSDERFRFACELVRNEKIGKLNRIIIGSASYNQVPVQPVETVPEGFDYDMWLGPAPFSPYTHLRCTRNFTLIYDYSVGCISGAWGIHHVDIAQWALNADRTGPVAVEGTGTVASDGLYDTIQTWWVEHTYANGVKVIHTDHISVRAKIPQFNVPASMGILFEGSEGWIYVARGYIDAQPKNLLRSIISPNEIQLQRSNDHRRNFLDAVKTRELTICPIETAVRSDTLCHQADIAIRLGQKLYWDPVKEKFIDNPWANLLLSRSMRSPWHL